jgi:hypothetical protein
VKLEAQHHFNKTMAKFEKEDLNDLNEEKKIDRRDDCASSVSSGDTFKCMNSVDLNSQSRGSQQLSSRSRGSGRSASSSNLH